MVRSSTENQGESILGKIIYNQEKHGTTPTNLKPEDKIGFAFNTKDRIDLSLKCLPTIDQNGGFDMIWCDGSDTKEGQELPDKYVFKNVRLKGIFKNVKGGPDKAIQFSLKKLIDMGYDYCGLIENDILFEPGCFSKLKNIISLAYKDGVVVGAASVRNYRSRVLEFRDGYSINWNIGAGMILLSRKAAQLILDNYDDLYNFGRKLSLYYLKTFDVDLRKSSEPARYFIGKPASADFSYDMILYKNGLASISSVPSLVKDIGIDINERELVPVDSSMNNLGVIYKSESVFVIPWLYFNVFVLRIFWFFWKNIGRIKFMKKREKWLESFVRRKLRFRRGLKTF